MGHALSTRVNSKSGNVNTRGFLSKPKIRGSLHNLGGLDLPVATYPVSKSTSKSTVEGKHRSSIERSKTKN
jgi:hypothetical protein